MRPNIFEIATKELHQDAFITWLLLWADPDNKEQDSLLHACGQEFVRLLISTQYGKELSAITKVYAGRQWDNVDVWAEVYTTDKKFLIVIEDKTFSTEHSGQLEVYKEQGRKYCAEQRMELICVYLKTGSEPERILNEIRAKGYATFGRTDFIGLLKKHPSIGSDIFIDFRERLQRLEDAHQAFEHTPTDKWSDQCWIGFYQLLEKEIGLVHWHYVNPPSGKGFWNACLNWEQWTDFPVYQQIEQGRLAFKISTDPADVEVADVNRSQVRNEWHRILKEGAQQEGLAEIKKPERFGSGKYMTVAVVEQDAWLSSKDGVFVKEQTIANINKYKAFLLRCIDHGKLN